MSTEHATTQIEHHIEPALLLAYASGATDEPASLIVATHLALCAECRRTVADAEAAGGVFLEDAPPAAVEASSLDRVLARLNGQEIRKAAKPVGITPEPLRSYLGAEVTDVDWRHLAGGISEYRIMQRGRSVVRLLKARPSSFVYEHTHKGEEVTLILTGGLTDHTGAYHRGDVQTMTNEYHVPTALPGEDCIVLAVTTAPLRFRDWRAQLFAKWKRF
ncbi:MAG TPA: ChrR family anti-sigma-E factor [Rhizomicrobium sp.]|jgi:putative transcriptional regulator|nr:ChrR family anti-sigma-E factor [Rhizomicrobium sp.]